MYGKLCVIAIVLLASPTFVGGQATPELEMELRDELKELKARLARLEMLLEQLEANRMPPAESPATSQRAPGLNTPPVLPPSRAEAFEKPPPRFDVLILSRADFFSDPSRGNTFFFKKAELGIKGHITRHTDFSFELDPVRPGDPYRRTYIRLTYLPWLHVKVGLEKAPIGLEELTSTAQIPFVERSEVTDRFAAAEELGVHLESRWPNWLFQFSVTNGGRRLLRDDNDQKDMTARIVWAPRRWFSIGGATLQGHNGPDGLEKDRYGAELKLGSNLSGFQAEFFRAKDALLWSSAYYVSGYRAFRTGRPLLSHLQPVLRYEQIGRSDRDVVRQVRLVTFGLSLLFDEHHSKLQFNYLKDLQTGSLKDQVRAQYQIEF